MDECEGPVINKINQQKQSDAPFDLGGVHEAVDFLPESVKSGQNRPVQHPMADPYEGAKGGKLTFKGGGDPLEERKKKKKKQKRNKKEQEEEEGVGGEGVEEEAKEAGGEVYTIDAAKRLKYDQLFPVEAKKFGYGEQSKKPRSVEEALDDRVKKKADRYCK